MKLPKKSKVKDEVFSLRILQLTVSIPHFWKEAQIKSHNYLWVKGKIKTEFYRCKQNRIHNAE